jgi:uncharacterized protein (TIGR03643 family)
MPECRDTSIVKVWRADFSVASADAACPSVLSGHFRSWRMPAKLIVKSRDRLRIDRSGSGDRTLLRFPPACIKSRMASISSGRGKDNLTDVELTAVDLDRIIQMTGEDRTFCDSIRNQFGLSCGEVIKLMRQQLSSRSFELWRKRTAGRRTKHQALRDFRCGRFRSPRQRG